MQRSFRQIGVVLERGHVSGGSVGRKDMVCRPRPGKDKSKKRALTHGGPSSALSSPTSTALYSHTSGASYLFYCQS